MKENRIYIKKENNKKNQQRNEAVGRQKECDEMTKLNQKSKHFKLNKQQTLKERESESERKKEKIKLKELLSIKNVRQAQEV